jgi:hypothetical protein
MMNKLTVTTYAKEKGGRVSVLFLLFLLAMYELVTAGLPVFAAICLLPLVIVFVVSTFRQSMLIFWILIVVNFFIMWHGMYVPIPLSLPNEMLEILLLVLAIIDVQNSKFERALNLMLLGILLWVALCVLEVLNDTCGIGIDVGAWYTTARSLAFQILYAFLIFSIYISSPQRLHKYMVVWGCLALLSAFWIWKQKYMSLTPKESSWLFGAGSLTHVLQGGTLIRYFSFYNDAANCGIGTASTAVAFLIFGITAKIKKYKYFFLITGLASVWAVFPSGTRTAIVCLAAGIMAYVFLSKSIKIAVPVITVFSIFAFILAFTTIGNGNQQIRRMRSAFDKNDASANVRSINQAAMKKYLAEAPWGIGMAVGFRNVPANNKYTFMATVAPDSEYVFIWIHTGVIGLTVFIISTIIMIFGACRIVFFVLKSPSLRGIGAGFCCAMISQQLGGYGNQVLMQFPNCLIFYGGLAIVYVLPYLEKDWIVYEEEQLALEAEKKRLKLAKKEAKRV